METEPTFTCCSLEITPTAAATAQNQLNHPKCLSTSFTVSVPPCYSLKMTATDTATVSVTTQGRPNRPVYLSTSFMVCVPLCHSGKIQLQLHLQRTSNSAIRDAYLPHSWSVCHLARSGTIQLQLHLQRTSNSAIQDAYRPHSWSLCHLAVALKLQLHLQRTNSSITSHANQPHSRFPLAAQSRASSVIIILLRHR